MDLKDRISLHFDDAATSLQHSTQQLQEPLAQATHILVDTINQGNKVLACGNGGSAADAQHFIAELVGRFERDRIPLAGVALNTDTSILTAVGNDYSFDVVFERQVQALGMPGDLLVAITTSGNSANVLKAIHAAHDRGMRVIALSGKKGGALNDILLPDDVHLCVPHDRTMRIQEIHILLLHILCDGLDAFLLGDF
ncbi:phosphoheptose isomerase [Pelistega europaea]|uniref:Phosphoheptose isomerase n=1 Tax=Pelistega europaea TaxID=106147 RepID=A0A7Y4P6H8_9BURK|nr:phosphoheptose isomerase [Pelistega europaea]NOL49934.1 phosphoheptose isomerase [Pelistega europaea]